MIDNRSGIAAMCLAQLGFIASDTLVKLAATALPASQILVVRGAFAIALMGAVVLWLNEFRHWRALMTPIMGLRTLLELGGALTFQLAIAHVSLADITAIVLLTPLVITVLSVPLLGERVGWRRRAAVAVGFVGVLLVVKPGGGGLAGVGLLALAVPFFVATRDLVTRRLASAVPTVLAAFASTLAMAAGGVGLTAIQPWAPIEGTHLAYLAAASIVVSIGNVFVIRAFRNVEVSVVSPFRYVALLYAAIAGYLVFGDVPDPVSGLGIGLIVGAGLYTLWRERVRRGS